MKKFGLLGLLSFVLLVFTLTSYASQQFVATSPPTKESVAQTMQWFNAIGNFKQTSKQEISAHFANKFLYIMNGKVVATDIDALHQRWIKDTRLKVAYLHFPVDDVLIQGNKATVKYKVTFVGKNGVKQDTTNTAILTFDHEGKIVKCEQSFGIGDPMVVYS